MLKRLLWPALLLGVIVFGIQMISIHRPFLGHFSSYQLVMASMARNMERENFTELLLPKTDLLINGKRSLHLNQYPFPSVLAALGNKIIGGGLEFWGRFQSIILNAASALLLALIAGVLWGERQARAALAVYAFSPFALLYGQGFFSEPLSLFFFLLGFYLLLRNEELGWGTVLGSALSFSIALTGRIHWILFLPLPALWIGGQKKNGAVAAMGIFGLAAIALPAAWYFYTYQVSMQSDHILTNLFVQASERGVINRNYLLDPNYYKRILDIVSGLMLTPLLFPFLILGLLAPQDSRPRFLLWGAMGAGILLIILCPQKIMAHDFYLYPLFPFLCLAAADGVVRALRAFQVFEGRAYKVFFLLLYLGISSRYFFHPIFHHKQDAALIKSAAEAVQKHTRPEESIIIAGREPAPLTYYADRPAYTMDLKIGRAVPYYLSNPRFSRIDMDEVKRFGDAMKDPVTWVDYLRGKGASYIVAPDKKELERAGLLPHLESQAENLASPQDKFALFKFKS